MVTPAQQIKDWVREQIEGREGIHLSELTDEALEYIKADNGLLEEFIQTRIRPAVYSTVQGVVAETRKVYGDYAPTVKEERRKRVEFKSRFRGFMQETSDGHRDVWTMNRVQLRDAGDIRLKAGRQAIVLGRTFHELANMLKTDSQILGNVLNDEQIEEVVARIEGEVNEA